MMGGYSRSTRSFRTGLALAAALVSPTTLVLPSPLAAQNRAWDSVLAGVAAGLEADVQADDVGGIAVGVAVDGDLVWARAFGDADREHARPLRASAISRIGSISKSVTAVLMMRLVDQGVIALDDPVASVLPEIAGLRSRRPDAPAVTFRHLASHTAGLMREPRLRGAASGPIEDWEDKVLASIRETAFDSVPGARYQYSNIGFGILGLALSRAAGTPFTQLVQREVFEPLGMIASTFVVGPDLAPRLATGYANARNGDVNATLPALEHGGRGYKVPNGGVYSTLADLARLAGALGGTPGLRILSEESRREMLTVQTPEDPERGYGLGFALRRDPSGRLVASHGGSVAGYTAHLALDLDTGIAVVLLRNYNVGETNLGRTAAALLAELNTAGH